MPAGASRVLGRSVRHAVDKARQLVYDQLRLPPLQNIDIRDEFAPARACDGWRQPADRSRVRDR